VCIVVRSLFNNVNSTISIVIGIDRELNQLLGSMIDLRSKKQEKNKQFQLSCLKLLEITSMKSSSAEMQKHLESNIDAFFLRKKMNFYP
jgi:hypothetical protein